MNSLRLSIPADHPAYAGHFPDRPILPGVVLLDRVQRTLEQACALRIGGLAMVKFLSPVLPGDELRLDFEATAAGLRFELRCGERRVASGRYTVAS